MLLNCLDHICFSYQKLVSCHTTRSPASKETAGSVLVTRRHDSYCNRTTDSAEGSANTLHSIVSDAMMESVCFSRTMRSRAQISVTSLCTHNPVHDLVSIKNIDRCGAVSTILCDTLSIWTQLEHLVVVSHPCLLLRKHPSIFRIERGLNTSWAGEKACISLNRSLF